MERVAYGVEQVGTKKLYTITGVAGSFLLYLLGLLLLTGNTQAADISITTATIGTNGGGGTPQLALGQALTITSTGSIITNGAGQAGVYGLHTFADAVAASNASVTVVGSLQNLAANSIGIAFGGVGNVANLSGIVSSNYANSYSISMDACTYLLVGVPTPDPTVGIVNLLRNVSISGDMRNVANLGSTSYLTFGYATDGSNHADLTTVDNSFNFTFSSNITSTSAGNWDGYLAGGTTTLNGTTNQLRKLLIGGAIFDSAAIVGTATTFGPIAGATATLNVTNTISTTGAVSVGAGSTYNLSGTHTHSGASFAMNGTMNLSGNGLADINAGVLAVGSTGTLAGTGTIEGNVTTAAGSTITPGSSSNAIGTVTITGNATIDGNVDVNYTPTSSDRLAVSGNLTLNNSSRLRVTPQLGGQANTSQTVVTAGTLTNNGIVASVTENSVLIDYETTVTAGAGGKVTVTSRAVENAYRSASSSANSNMASAMDRLTVTHSSEMDVIFDKMNRLSSNAEVNTAMTQLNGGNSVSAFTQVGLASVQQSNVALSSQFTSLRHTSLAKSLTTVTTDKESSRAGARAAAGGMPTDEESKKALRKKMLDADANANPYRKWGGTLKFYGGFGEESSSGEAVGYDFGGAGVLTCLDYALSQEFRAGGLIDYSYNRANLYNDLGNATDNVLRVGPFGSFTWDNLYVDTAPTVGLHLINTQRNINFLNTTATGERTGFDINWFNDVGYRFDLPKGFMLTPSYGLGFTAMYDPSYTETGAANGGNLKFDEYTTYSLQQKLELKLGRVFQITKSISLLPEVWGGWEHEYLNNTGDVTTAFAAMPSQSWTAPVNSIAQDRAVFGASLTTLITDRWSVFGRYDSKLWQGGSSNNFAVGIKIFF